MRLLSFPQTAIIILFNVSACFGATSYTSREERMGTLNASDVAASTDIILTRAKAIDGVHENNMSSSDGKNNEARGINPVAVHMVDPNVEKGEMIAKLSSDLKTELGLGTQASTGNIAKVLEHEHWAAMIKETDDWLLKKPVNPKTVFSYMKLESIFDQDMDMVTMSHDPKLLLWFRYIIEYRHMDDPMSKYAAFDNEKLLGLLVSHMKARVSSELAHSLHDKSLPDPHLQVVTLFETYRHEPSMGSFAEDMLTYMVTDSTTKDHVLNVWLQKKESPITIFSVLHLNDEARRLDLDDKTVLTAWLNYVKLYMNSGAPDFDGDSFIRLLLPTMSMPRARRMFESNALEHELGDVDYKNGNLASYLREVWQRVPELMFSSSQLSGRKIPLDFFPTFMKPITDVAPYLNKKRFDGAIVYSLLEPAFRFEDMEGLFEILKQSAKRSEVLSASQRSDVGQFADNMLQYLSASSFPVRLSRSELHLEKYTKVDAQLLLLWVTRSTKYYMLVERYRLNEAISIVMDTLLGVIAKSKLSSTSWLEIMDELREVDEGLWNLVRNALPQSRKRKTSPAIQGEQSHLQASAKRANVDF